MASKRIKPSKTTQSKIYLRTPKKKYLKITSKPLEEAMLIPAAKPKKSSIVKVLSAKTEVVAVAQAQAGATKITKPYKPTVQLANLEKSKPGRKTKLRKGSGVDEGIMTPKSIRPYDHQPMFEGGFRIVQGGLPELGKRR